VSITFAAGLKRDHTAVVNGLTMPYSSGASRNVGQNRIELGKWPAGRPGAGPGSAERAGGADTNPFAILLPIHFI